MASKVYTVVSTPVSKAKNFGKARSFESKFREFKSSNLSGSYYIVNIISRLRVALWYDVKIICIVPRIRYVASVYMPITNICFSFALIVKHFQILKLNFQDTFLLEFGFGDFWIPR